MELKEEELEKIFAGNSQDISEKIAIDNPYLFRNRQMEELKEEELEKIFAGNSQGMSEKIAIDNPNLFRDEQIEELRETIESLFNEEKSHDDAPKIR